MGVMRETFGNTHRLRASLSSNTGMSLVVITFSDLYFFFSLPSIVSVKIGILVIDYLGIHHCMDKFKGRAKKD